MPKRSEEPTPERLSLGEYLKNQRLARRLTLREVEEATDKAVSNAYLSQLENERVSKPSPNILFHLSEVYAVPYDLLMEKAGYIVSKADRDAGEKHGRVATFADDSLTQEEEEQLLKYLAFLRSQRRPGR